MSDWRSRMYDARRTGWAVFLAALGALFIGKSGREILAQQFGVLAWKVVLLGVAVLLAHRIRMQLLPYVDLSEHAGNGGSGQVFLGVCVLYAAIILAFLSGL